MRSLKGIGTIVLLSGVLAVTSLYAAERQSQEGKKTKLKPYTLKTCLVTDEKLGGMGDSFVHQYKDREIKFCCKGCLKDFNKDPGKYIKKLEAAEKSAKEAPAANTPAPNQSAHQH